MAAIVPGGGRAFLTNQELSDCVERLCTSWRLPPVSRRTCQRYRVAPFEDKRTAALISQSHRVLGRDNALLYDGFFSFAVVRQSLLLNYHTLTRAGLYFSLHVFVKFRLRVFVKFRLAEFFYTGQRSIPGSVQICKVTNRIDVD